jgi:beta-galactosidase/beta-glucuronidase
MSCVPRAEHPRPDLRRDDAWWLNLNGRWEFEIDRSASGEERGYVSGRRLAGEITVPFCPESPASGVGERDFMNCVWYRRQLGVPDAWSGRRVLLHVGACDYWSAVWLNGQRVGGHEGGYTPFTVELTDSLRGGGRDELVIRALDDARLPAIPRGKQSPRHESHGCLYTRTTGIWQTVWLEAVPRTFVHGVHVWPDADRGKFLVQLFVQGSGPFRGRVRALADGEEAAWAGFAGRGAGRVDAVVALREPRLWSPADPFLYEFEITLEGEGGEDSVRTWCGLRKFQTEGNRFLLNNEPIFLRTVLDQGFYPDGVYTAPTVDHLRRDIELSKSLGFNGARLHQKVFEPAFLHLCDRLGYMVFGEFADWGYDFRAPQFTHRMLDQWTEALLRDLSHPAVIGWCPLNETMSAGSEQCGEWALRTLYRLTKLVDPTRPALDTSGYFHYVTDVWDCHNYDQDVARLAAAFAPLAEGRPKDAFTNSRQQLPYDGRTPYFVSEFGGIWWNPGQQDDKAWGYGDRPRTEQEFLDRFDGMVGALLDNPGVAGFCYTQLTDVEQEVNGLLTYDRRPKFPPERIARAVTRRAAIER